MDLLPPDFPPVRGVPIGLDERYIPWENIADFDNETTLARFEYLNSSPG